MERAAPELLDACKLAVRNTERAIGDPTMFLPIRYAAQAAVAKAEAPDAGETTPATPPAPEPFEGNAPDKSDLLAAAEEVMHCIETMDDPKGHLIDTDDNPGERLRKVIARHRLYEARPEVREWLDDTGVRVRKVLIAQFGSFPPFTLHVGDSNLEARPESIGNDANGGVGKMEAT
jgi:hypothetical protein